MALAYGALGVEHILLGVDHLLFVLALLVLVEGWRRLVWWPQTLAYGIGGVATFRVIERIAAF